MSPIKEQPVHDRRNMTIDEISKFNIAIAKENIARENHCWYVNEKDEQCGDKAEWTIYYGDAPDDYVPSCSKHIGDMVKDGVVNYLYPILET